MITMKYEPMMSENIIVLLAFKFFTKKTNMFAH